jgi:LuxR family transcriptional regulator, maltose regulon positive regulatory protein
MERLEAHREAPLTVVQAPAGYGKSIILQQWARRLAETEGGVAWFSVDRADREPTSFLNCVVQAFAEGGLEIAPRVSSILGREKYYAWKIVVSALANGFFDVQRPWWLVLDDAHYLRDSEALNCLQLLIEAAPPMLHLVLATREDLGIPLGRARALGQILELRADDLRFLPEEAASFLELEGHAPLSQQDAIRLQQRTEGWIVGLKLISLSLRNAPQPARLSQPVSGEQRQVADFFSEDVVARQSAELREFLMRTSVLDRFCPALCDRLLGHQNSRRLIDECERAGLFLVPLDQTRDWYRYHHLFAEFLGRCLQDQFPGERERLCLEAAAWLVEAGYIVEGFEYALRGNNPMRAAEILEAACDELWRAGRQDVFQRLAARIPPHIQALHPRIMLAIAWRLCMQWQIGEARNLIAVSKTRLAELERTGQADGRELARLRALVKHRECQLAHVTYDPAALERQSQTDALEIQSLDDPYTLTSYYNSLHFAEREQYKLSRIDRLTELARAAIEHGGSEYPSVFHAAIAGASYLLAGRTQRALAVLTQAVEVAVQLAGPSAPLTATAAIPLAQVHYELNETDRARELLDRHQQSNTIGFVDQLIVAATLRARLECLASNYVDALRTLQDAVEFADSHELTRLATSAHLEAVNILLRKGQPDDAARHARSSALFGRKDVADLIQQHNPTRLDGAIAAGWCRLMATQSRVQDALRVARWWRAFVTNAGATQEAVRWDILNAQLLMLSGDRLAAHRALSQALAKAAQPRLIRVFLDEGESIAQMLVEIARAPNRTEDPNEPFLRELISSFRKELRDVTFFEDEAAMTGPLCGRMSSREIQILELAATGMPNQQIGSKLGLTEGSVKWYLQQIFDKVGVRDRFLAAKKARQFGLMK